MRATRSTVASAYDSNDRQPRQRNSLIKRWRICSYSTAARSGSASRNCSSPASASPVSAHFFLSLLMENATRSPAGDLALRRRLPLALQRERGPVVRRLPCLLPPHLDLRLAQRRRRARLLLAEQLPVELRHELARGFVVDLPETGDQARRARVHETARQPDQTFTADLLAESGLTCAQHQELGRQPQVVDVVEPQESVLGAALAVDQRQHQP